ncbi:hypothetical protein CYMTET_17988 [Cymbomonas tetramitiformis]|uniref:histidine kinase n=1 Tax=Cymbomonas tetramitiformis TaxID=36881 RepID=A0AAE0G950_9CHLO|nr:hypothetical protein CYMTET_17988 [Cymbomonas tetramitiformis]
MSNAHQRARVTAIRAALESLRVYRRDSATGYGLVVSGGAYAPDTRLESIAFAIDQSFDSFELAPRHPQLYPPPCAPLGRCLVVACGGANAPIASTPLLFTFAIMCGEDPRRVCFLTSIATPALVVPGRVGSWHRRVCGEAGFLEGICEMQLRDYLNRQDEAFVPMLVLDADFKILSCNDAWAQLCDKNGNQMIGTPFKHTLSNKSDMSKCVEDITRALADTLRTSFTVSLSHSDGKDRLVLVTASDCTEAGEKRIVLIGQDASCLRSSDSINGEVPKASGSDSFENLLDYVSVPCFIVNTAGIINTWNSFAEDTFLYKREEVLGKSFLQHLVAEEYHVSLQEVLDIALRGHGTANFEFPLCNPDGIRIEISLNATCRRDAKGTIIGIVIVAQDITERRGTWDELEEVALGLRALIDTANAPIFGVDKDGKVNEWNNKIAEIMSFSQEEVMGRNLVDDFITLEYKPAVRSVLDNALRGQETANFEFPLLTKNQERVDVLLNATTRRSKTGKIIGVFGVGQDITERKQSELELQRLAQDLRALIDTANAPIFGIDKDGRVNEWNNKAAEITKFTQAEVMGRHLVEDFITSEYKIAVKRVLDNALKGKETTNFEFPLFTKDDERVEVLLNATCRRDAAGAIVGVVGVGQDITERKQTAMDLERVAKDLRALIDTANAPIFGIDKNGLVNEWNNKAAEITKYTQAEVMGRNLVGDFITSEYKSAVRHVLDNALRGQETANFEFPLFTKDDQRVEVLLNATPRRDVAGDIVGVVGVGQDITEKKQTADELAWVAQDLRALIDTANAPIFGIDKNGLVNEWNFKAAEITKYTQAEVMGRNMVDHFITSEYKTAVRRVLDNALRGQETANFEFPLFSKDQMRVEILLNATTRRDASGNIVGVVGVGQDITERKKTEGEMQRVAQDLRALIDTANAPIFGIDKDGLVNEWNDKATEITRYTQAEVMGRNLVEDFITLEYKSAVWRVLDNALQGQEAANFEFPLFSKSNERVEVLLNATTRRDANGSIVGVVGVGQVITERKQAEGELLRVAQDLRALIDTANAPIFGIDKDGLVNEWNDKAAEITGFAQAEVMGRNLVDDFITLEFKSAVRGVLDLALKGKETANFEFPLYTKDHQRVEVLLNATSRRDTSGNIVGVVGVGQDITTRKKSEGELERVAKDLRALIDTANAPIFGIDKDGNVNEWNNKAAEITGFTQAEVMGRNLVDDFITSEYKQAVRRVLDTALRGQETANFEFPLFTKDNQRVDVLLNATPRRDEREDIVGVVGVGQDITERKNAEGELKRVAQDLRTLIDTANAPIFGIDKDGLVNEWNNKAAEITKYTQAEVMGRNLVDDFITLEFKTAVKGVLDLALKEQETANFEFPLFTKTGERVEVLLNATTRRDAKGNIVGVVGVGQDITEKKQTADELERMAQDLRALIDTANAPIFGIDKDGNVNEWNNKAAEITRFTQTEVMGRSLVDEFITSEYKTAVRGVLDKALTGKETANFEFPLFTKDGQRVDVLLNATTRRDKKGEIVGVVGVGQDITERKLAELEMERMAQDLRALIDTANAPIFGIDKDGNVNEWNNKAAEITKFSQKEVMGRSLVDDFIHVEYKTAVKKVLDNALLGQETANFEFPLFTRDNQRVEVLLNATTRRNGAGDIVGVVGVGQDITEKKQTADELERMAQDLRALIDTANAPIFGIDKDGNVNEWNNKAAEITRFPQTEVMGRSLVDEFITDEYKTAVRGVLDKALKGKETANFEFPLFTKDGQRVDVLLNATTRRDKKGEIVGVVGVGQDITERKLAELEMERMAQDLRALIDTANAPIFGIDKDGMVNEWNHKAAEITGFTQKEVMGRSLVGEFIHVEYKTAVKKVLDNALLGQETANFEFPLFTKDNERVEVLLNATTRRNGAGDIVGVVGVGQDITEKKQTADELERMAQDLRALIDTANAPIFGIDKDGNVNEWNNKAAEITRFPQTEVMGRSLVDEFITDEYKTAVRGVLDKALKGKETANFEFPLFTKDGQRVDVLLNATTRRDKKGEIVGVVGVGQDITERKLAELEMERMAQDLRALIDTANAPIFGIDKDGMVNEWNHKAAEITGFIQKEVMGHSLVGEFIHVEYKTAVKKVLDNALLGQETANFKFPLFTKDNQRVEVLLNATTRRDGAGDIVGVVGVGQDITEKKQTADELERVAQDLRALIDTANAPIFGIDKDGNVNEWNNKAAEITRFTQTEVMGRSLVDEFITDEYRTAVKTVLDNALRGEQTANFEFPLFTKDGQRVEVLLNATTRRDGAGDVVGVVGVGQDITEKKQTATEMERMAQDLRALIDTANAPIFGIDKDGNVNEWNNKAAEITKFSQKEVMGRSLVGDFIHVEYKTAVKKVLDNALLGQETANFEFPLFTRDNQRVEVLLNATTRRDGAGDIVGVVGVGQDITEKKQTADELERMAQDLRALIDTANAPIFGIDKDGNVNEWNNKAAEITKFTQTEVMGRSLVDEFITDEYKTAVREVLDLALKGKETANFEFPLFTKDNERVDVLLNATTRRDKKGEIVGVVGVGQDITERKLAEEELERMAQDLRALIDTANAPIFGIDKDGNVNEWNNKAAEITKFSQKEVMGRSLVDDFITDEYKTAVREVLDLALKSQETANFEFPLFTKDNERVDVLLNATTRRDRKGEIVGVVGVGQDITERKLAEEELERMAQDLRALIDTANAPIFGIDKDGFVNEWNNKAAEITKFSQKEVMGRSLVDDFITVEYKTEVKGVLDLALKGVETANFEFPLFTKDKQRVEVLLNATTRRDKKGDIVGVVGVGQDITERKLAEGELERVAQDLRALIDTANAPIFGINKDGLVNEWNHKAAELTLFMQAEVMGRHLVDEFITSEYKTAVRGVLDLALKGKETANFEFPLFTKTGERVEVLLNATTRRDAKGSIIGVVGVGQEITERKKAEGELQRVAMELRALIDTANAPIFGIDKDGRVNEWNNKAAEITGFTQAEVMGQNLVDRFITLEYKTAVKRVLDLARKGQETANFEFPLFTKNDQRVEVLLNATTRRDSAGDIIGVVGVGQDITEKKQTADELERVAQDLRALIDTANAPIFGIDKNGCVNEWNNMASTITMYEKEEVMGRNLVEDFITLEYKRAVKRVLDNALRGQETANFEFPLFTKNQDRVDVLLNATTRRDTSGMIVGVVGVGQDITERKKADEELERVAQDLRALIDTANAPIFGIDRNGCVNEWNQKAADITKYTQAEVMGRNLVDHFITSEYKTAVRRVLDNALRGQETANFEFPLFTKDQVTRVEVLLNATMRRDKKGEIVGVVGVGQDITERKKTEGELQRVAQDLRGLIDTANAPIFGIDKAGRVNEWNNKAAEITKFMPSEVMGRNLVDDFITLEYKTEVKGVLDLALRGQETANFEFPLFTKEGHRVEVLLNATTRRDAAGETVGVVGVGQDITERKKAELELTRMAQDLRTLIDTAHAPIFGIDKDGLVNEWNNMASTITGYPKEEVMGRDLVEDFITSEYKKAVKGVLDDALQGRETANFEFSLFTKNQHRVQVLLNANPRRNATGSIVGVVGVGQNITERKKAEQQLEHVAQDLRALIDTANAPIFGINDKGMVNEWNQKAAYLTEYSREDVMDKHLVSSFISPEYKASVERVLHNALQGIETASFEVPFFTKTSKKRVDLLLNANPRCDTYGRIVGVVGVGQDITAKRRAMEADAQLSRSRAANEAKSQFLANMSHEMRTPLNGIIGLNQLLLQTNLDTEQKELAKLVQSSSDSLLNLINDILDLTRVESGKLELEYVEFDLLTMVEDTMDSVSSIATKKGLEMICTVDPDMCNLVRADADRIKQVLLNLLSNAIKFTREGEVEVTVMLLESTQRNHNIQFSVRDTGIGIPDTALQKLFTRFTQVDSSTTRNYGGTGLGLAISKQLAELMNGSIQVTSVENEGSTFSFNVLMDHSEEAVLSEEISAGPDEFKQMSVFVVVTNKALWKNLAELLRRWHFGSVTIFDNYKDATEHFTLHPEKVYNFVILSVNTIDQVDIDKIVVQHQKRAEHWLVLAPISHVGTLKRMSLVWTVLSKPVRKAQLLVYLRQRVSGQHLEEVSREEQRNGHILVVEDNATVQQQLRNMLTNVGYIVDIAGNGKEAQYALSARSYCCCLMDMFMPVQDGLEATREIRSMEQKTGRMRLRIIGISAGSEQEKNEFRTAGCDAFICKPLQRKTVLDAISFVTSLKEENISDDSGEQNISDEQKINMLVVDDNRANQVMLARLLKSFNYSTQICCNGLEAVEAVQQIGEDKYAPPCIGICKCC